MVKGYSIQHKISLSFLSQFYCTNCFFFLPPVASTHVTYLLTFHDKFIHMKLSFHRMFSAGSHGLTHLLQEGKVKRLYVLKVNSLSAKSLQLIFQRYTSENASVSSDKCKGHIPIGNNCKVMQIPSELGLNSEAIHTMIHQVKSWLRTTYSWVSKRHIDRYLSEFSYLINRSQTKTTSFHNLIKHMA